MKIERYVWYVKTLRAGEMTEMTIKANSRENFEYCTEFGARAFAKDYKLRHPNDQVWVIRYKLRPDSEDTLTELIE